MPVDNTDEHPSNGLFCRTT